MAELLLTIRDRVTTVRDRLRTSIAIGELTDGSVDAVQEQLAHLQRCVAAVVDGDRVVGVA